MRLNVIIGLLLLSLIARGQSLTGTYKGQNTNEVLEFVSDNEIKFQIYQPDGLGETLFCGNGIYKYDKNKLIINVLTHDKSLESGYSILKDSIIQSGFIIKGQVVTEKGDLIPGVNFRFKIGKNYKGFTSNLNGYFNYKFEKKPDSEIEICLIGYSCAYLNYVDKSAVDYKFILKESKYRFIDNRRLTMNIILDSDNKTFMIKRLKVK